MLTPRGPLACTVAGYQKPSTHWARMRAPVAKRLRAGALARGARAAAAATDVSNSRSIKSLSSFSSAGNRHAVPHFGHLASLPASSIFVVRSSAWHFGQVVRSSFMGCSEGADVGVEDTAGAGELRGKK